MKIGKKAVTAAIITAQSLVTVGGTSFASEIVINNNVDGLNNPSATISQDIEENDTDVNSENSTNEISSEKLDSLFDKPEETNNETTTSDDKKPEGSTTKPQENQSPENNVTEEAPKNEMSSETLSSLFDNPEEQGTTNNQSPENNVTEEAPKNEMSSETLSSLFDNPEEQGTTNNETPRNGEAEISDESFKSMFDKQEDVQEDDFRYDDKITIREILFNAFKSHGQKRSNVNKVETEKTTNNKKEVTVILKSSL